MKLQFVEKYKGYTLHCAPQATHDEGFLAFLIVTHGARPVQVDCAAALELEAFALQGEAALAALSAGIRWVDEEVSLMGDETDTEDPAAARPFFDELARLRELHGGAERLPELSMGMTHDLEQAVGAGATFVRVGTAIFGERNKA